MGIRNGLGRSSDEELRPSERTCRLIHGGCRDIKLPAQAGWSVFVKQPPVPAGGPLPLGKAAYGGEKERDEKKE